MFQVQRREVAVGGPPLAAQDGRSSRRLRQHSLVSFVFFAVFIGVLSLSITIELQSHGNADTVCLREHLREHLREYLRQRINKNN